ncbi:MAG: hypothetical protein IT249_08085 [Chitinophagaceae bacterium]|nr:hypothetical protein [Chitinophagaceae bacterium]
MALGTSMAAELKHEASNTRKILSRIPEAHFDWKPHEKSMTIGRLASHIAELTLWAGLITNANEFDFAKTAFNRCKATNSKELLEAFEQNLEQAVAVLQSAADETLNENWILCRGEIVVVNLPKKVALRTMLMNHIIHHRGQLSVYLRLLNIPVPGMYGPSADEK